MMSPPNVTGVLQSGLDKALIDLEQLLTREEGATSEENPHLFRGRFTNLYYMFSPGECTIDLNTNHVDATSWLYSCVLKCNCGVYRYIRQ